MFALKDEGDDTSVVTTGSQSFAGIITYTPVTIPTSLGDGTPFLPRPFDSGTGGTPPCTGNQLPESVFRGDVQPATAFDNANGVQRGVVFFAGNRLNLPNSAFAPPTPFKYCTGQYPCRSSYDSIVYALGASSGQAAYNLGGSDGAYQIFYNSRTGSIGILADPDPAHGGSVVVRDETLIKAGVPVPAPPQPGIPPHSRTATNNVLPYAPPGKPVPSWNYGTSITCR